MKEQAQDIKKQDELNSSKQSNVLIVDSKSTEDTVSPDERFFIDENEKSEDIIEDDDKPKEKVFNSKLKKKMKKEKIKVKYEIFKHKIFSLFKIETGFIGTVAKILDFTLNMFSIAMIVVALVVTLNFMLNSNPVMTVVGCLFVWITIYLNKQIS